MIRECAVDFDEEGNRLLHLCVLALGFLVLMLEAVEAD